MSSLLGSNQLVAKYWYLVALSGCTFPLTHLDDYFNMTREQIIFIVFAVIFGLSCLLVMIMKLVRVYMSARQPPQNITKPSHPLTHTSGDPSRTAQYALNRYCSTGDPYGPDMLSGRKSNNHAIVGDSQPHDPYDTRYTYTCDCPDTWMGDGGSCPHS